MKVGKYFIVFIGAITGLIFLSIVFYICLTVFLFGKMGYESRKRCDAILSEWKNNKELTEIEDSAIKRMVKNETTEAKLTFKVPYGDTATFISIDEDRYLIEYGGGHHHYGVMIFRNETDADKEMVIIDPQCRNTRINRHIVFYDE